MSNFFVNEIDRKKFSKFFTAEFIEINFKIFLQSISLKKNSTFFRKIREKKRFATNKKESQGGNPPGESDMTLLWVLTLLKKLEGFIYSE